MSMDQKLIARTQKYEAYYISGKYHIPLEDVRKAMKGAGRSRKKVYAELRNMGYTIKTRSTK